MPTAFSEDVDFLKEHVETHVLSDASGKAQLAVVPAYQGRVMTSSAQGGDGLSFGWLNRELIASGATRPQFNAYGGEDRFWLGPEGGPFSLYFEPGAPLEFAHWRTPPCIDTEGFEVVSRTQGEAQFRHTATITNYRGTRFSIEFKRVVRLRPAAFPATQGVAYESENSLTNTGDAPWTKETGLLSIWILGMYAPSPETTIVLPFGAGRGGIAAVNDAYFGRIPAERLRADDRAVYLKGDGCQRGKIGLAPNCAHDRLGSYDPASGVLTVVRYSKPSHYEGYVNSLWSLDGDPFDGDAINAYNDGPTTPGGAPLGPFYELETSSPALALAPGESYTHRHETAHIQGEHESLEPIARDAFGVSLDTITSALR